MIGDMELAETSERVYLRMTGGGSPDIIRKRREAPESPRVGWPGSEWAGWMKVTGIRSIGH
ncbi:hypothetical protein [Cohnella herbarum]|uniref:hypothetical protein n=1 Tax=Cohnella herbarum TaxID=2728023 RepID=UPI0020C2E35B|nr:hypothetical protein [Cohnella herbarum]